MATLFIILISFGFIHFFIENAIIPTFRLEVKNDLVSILSSIQVYKRKYTKNNQKKIIEELETSILFTLNNIPSHNLLDYLYYKITKSKSEKDSIKKMSQKKLADLKESKIIGIETLHLQYFKAITKTFAINSFGFFIYAVPVFLIANVIYAIFKHKLFASFFHNNYNEKIVEYKHFENIKIKQRTPSNHVLEPLYC